MFVSLLVVKVSSKKQIEENELKYRMPKDLWICGVLLAFALFVVNLLVTEMGKTVNSVILFPISSAISILITTLVGFFVFKEKLSTKNIIGLILGLLSIIMISILTPENIAILFSK